MYSRYLLSASGFFERIFMTLLYSLVQMLFWAAYAIVYGYVSVYLLGSGFSLLVGAHGLLVLAVRFMARHQGRILLIQVGAAGEHAVLAHLDGYFDQSLKVTVKAKETKQLPFTLRRNFTADTEVETIHGAPVRGVLVKDKTNKDQIVLEIRPGIEQAIRRETIRKITNLKE